MKHTKGKWTAEQTDIHISVKPWRVLQGTKIICKLNSYDRYNLAANIEEEANAKLIAASPNQQEASILLYDLCKKLARMINYKDFGDVRDQWNKAMNAHEEAIKKATE